MLQKVKNHCDKAPAAIDTTAGSIGTTAGFLAVPTLLQRGKSCEHINDNDPDLGDSSKFQRRCHARSTWSSNRMVKKHDEIKKDQQQQKKHFLYKFGMIFAPNK